MQGKIGLEEHFATQETLAAMQSQFQYSLLTRASADRLAIVRTAATGQ